MLWPRFGLPALVPVDVVDALFVFLDPVSPADHKETP